MKDWRIVEIMPDDVRLKEHLRYVKRMSEELALVPKQKREVPNTFRGKPTEDLTQAERDDFYFSLQSQATQDALLAQRMREPEDDLEHLFRPLPDELEWKRDVVHRPISPEEFMVAKSNQRASKNTSGQSDDGSVDAKKRQRGIEALTYSKPADLTPEQLKKLTKLEEIVNTPLTPPVPTKEQLSFRVSRWLNDKTGIWWW